MYLKKSNIAAMALIVPLIALTGCAASGAGVNAEEAAQISDILTERKIQNAFSTEPGLSGSSIGIGCVGGVVTLSGDVDSVIEKNLAEQVASRIDGVTQVNNAITTN